MATEEFTDHFCLRLAQLWELMCDVGDRAVLLAQLLTDRPLPHRRFVTTLGERLSECL